MLCGQHMMTVTRDKSGNEIWNKRKIIKYMKDFSTLNYIKMNSEQNESNTHMQSPNKIVKNNVILDFYESFLSTKQYWQRKATFINPLERLKKPNALLWEVLPKPLCGTCYVKC